MPQVRFWKQRILFGNRHLAFIQHIAMDVNCCCWPCEACDTAQPAIIPVTFGGIGGPGGLMNGSFNIPFDYMFAEGNNPSGLCYWHGQHGWQGSASPVVPELPLASYVSISIGRQGATEIAIGVYWNLVGGDPQWQCDLTCAKTITVDPDGRIHCPSAGDIPKVAAHHTDTNWPLPDLPWQNPWADYATCHIP